MVKRSAPCTILGGLPVHATVSYGTDDFTGEGWAEVEDICWLRRDGKRGKAIPQEVFDRAEKYDPYFARLTEEVSDYNAYQDEE